MKRLFLSLAAAAFGLSLAGAAMAGDGNCSGYEQQTVKADTVVVATGPAPQGR